MNKFSTIGILTMIVILFLGGCSMSYPGKSILSQKDNEIEVILRLPTDDEREAFNNPANPEHYNGGMFYPNVFNKNEAISLKLANEDEYYDSYFYVQDLYRYIVEALPYENLDLAKYDKLVEQTGIAPRDGDDRI